MTHPFDLASRSRLALNLLEAQVRVLDCQEQVRQAYPDVREANAALSAARAHLVEVQRLFDQFRIYPETTPPRSCD